MLIRGGRDYWQQQSVEIITCKIILMALSCQQFELEIIHDGNLSSRGWMDVLSYSRVPFTQSVYQLLTLSDSQHQFHGFGSAHASVCVFQALQQACGGGWYAEGEKGHALKHISILVCVSSDHRNKIIEQCVVLLGFFAYDSVCYWLLHHKGKGKANKSEP